MKSYKDLLATEGWLIQNTGRTIKHPQVQECNQKSWHLPEDCTLPANARYGPGFEGQDND